MGAREEGLNIISARASILVDDWGWRCDCRRDGETGLSNVKGLMFTDRWKEELLTYVKLLMEQKKLGILSDDSALIAQMNEQQFEYLQPKTAREHIHMKFWHPLRRHDDQLFALALACYASKEEEPFIAVLPID